MAEATALVVDGNSTSDNVTELFLSRTTRDQSQTNCLHAAHMNASRHGQWKSISHGAVLLHVLANIVQSHAFAGLPFSDWLPYQSL